MITRQIGWSNESNLLYQILKQLTRLGSTLFSLKEAATPKYKVFTALVTQSGGDSYQELNSGDLTIGVTYLIIHTGGDFSNVGAPNNNANTYFVATGTTPNSWGSANVSYNRGAPTAIILENTIGNIWFTYEGVGVYYVNSNGLFTSGKTYSTPIYGDYTAGVCTSVLDDNRVVILNYNNFSLIGDTYNGIYNTPIEIRVYN